MLWSPTYVLATQIGNSFEISHILASFLIGFGFRAYVVCGYVEEAVSKMNRTEEKCPFLRKDEEKHQTDASNLTTKYTPKKVGVSCLALIFFFDKIFYVVAAIKGSLI